jgi:ADP-ribose pyrophosphatase
MPDTDERLARYFALARLHREAFLDGAARLLLDPADIAAVEAQTARRLKEQGEPTEASQVGVVVQDPRMYIVRDALEFPDGDRRLYTRIIGRTQGAAVLPVLDGELVLIRHFRHPMRRVLLEAPRGTVEIGDAPEETAIREVREEIGAEVKSLEPLGFLYGNTAVHEGRVYLYFAEIESVGEPQAAEGVLGIERYTPAQFEDLLVRGLIVDSYTVAAFAHARARRLI